MQYVSFCKPSFTAKQTDGEQRPETLEFDLCIKTTKTFQEF